ncbi:catalase [Amantichitinum ursilacus]|uniref:Catalase n=1 Tax=Amantichitinum ursilacus TaxID=857265 RepID=A0A0N0GQG7_9NEIS|nr:catalase [Amantichitinum ursilacus]KPC54441.1 Catalase HPII [Amantichitinum ursilacus]
MPQKPGAPSDLPAIEAARREFDPVNITTQQGLKESDDANSLKAGVRGPSLLQDFVLREKITHFDHERIPERIVHARGAAAHGVFQAYPGNEKYTKAGFLQDPAKQTPVFVRFSTVAGSRGSADLARDARGFAVKFYTDEGNFDLVGNNIPVFFIQDAIKFPDFVHSVKPEPNNEIPQAASAHDTFWDFISLTPESFHMIMWVMSDRAIPRSYRMMEGFGVHTFRFINAAGESQFIKWHWKPLLGTHGVAWDEALKTNGADPDFHRRDLWEAIENGVYPEWELGVQIISEADAAKLKIDLLDPTKIIPEEVIPVTKLGKMTLNRNPDNFFAETEQVAFHPGHVVPGIDFTNDPLLAGRLFSYTDTQLLRLGGPNFAQIPINRPVCPVHNFQRDGFSQQRVDMGRVAYAPSSLQTDAPAHIGKLPGGYEEFPQKADGEFLRAKPELFADHYSQATLFYVSLTPAEQKHLQNALKFELSKCDTLQVRERVVENLAHIDAELAGEVAKGLGLVAPAIPAPKLAPQYKPSPALSMVHPGGSVAGRKVAIIAGEGHDAAEVAALQAALKAEQVSWHLIAPTLAPVKDSKGNSVTPDATLENTRSVLYDAVFVPGGKEHIDGLRLLGKAKAFVAEAFMHCKPIAVGVNAAAVLDDANLPLADIGTDPQALKDQGIVVADSTGKSVPQDLLHAMRFHRFWDRPGVDKVAA